MLKDVPTFPVNRLRAQSREAVRGNGLRQEEGRKSRDGIFYKGKVWGVLVRTVWNLI